VSPTNAFTSADFPAFGAPNTPTRMNLSPSPSRAVASSSPRDAPYAAVARVASSSARRLVLATASRTSRRRRFASRYPRVGDDVVRVDGASAPRRHRDVGGDEVVVVGPPPALDFDSDPPDVDVVAMDATRRRANDAMRSNVRARVVDADAKTSRARRDAPIVVIVPK